MHAPIVEPEIFNAVMIEDTLRDIGYMSVTIAVSAKETISSAASRPPDLITAAVQLYGGCGIAAVQAICRRRDTAVVVFTENVAEAGRRIPGVIARRPLRATGLRSAIALTADAPAKVAHMSQPGALGA